MLVLIITIRLNHYNAYHQHYPVLTQVCILKQVLHTSSLLENDKEYQYADINSPVYKCLVTNKEMKVNTDAHARAKEKPTLKGLSRAHPF